MENISPEELNKWVDFLWSIGSKGLIVFVLVYYRDAVTYVIKAIIDFIFRK